MPDSCSSTDQGKSMDQAPYLLTPGPLNTSSTVKEAMLRDWGSRDLDFRSMTSSLRRDLLEVASRSPDNLDCVLVQGSGTFAVEAMLGSFIPPSGKALVLINGTYGRRVVQILTYLGRRHVTIDKGDFHPPRGQEVAEMLSAEKDVSHVVAVHCETSSGVLNPLAEIAAATRQAGCSLLVDAMSSFGALPIDPTTVPYDAVAASANKCLEGVPGVGFVIARKSVLKAAKGNSHSLSLDLHEQWQYMNRTGQWRFTPPTHVVAAFHRAMEEHRNGGGTAGRGHKYTRNRDALVSEMRRLGFVTLLPDRWMSPIIVTFLCPGHEAFEFERFYALMRDQGFVLYPGKLTVIDSFRIGCIGQLDERVMRSAARAVENALAEMGVPNGSPSEDALKGRLVN